jgi:hypothetical protein
MHNDNVEPTETAL